MSLPSLDRYVAALPDGFASFPAAVTKATVVLPWLDGAVGRSLRERADLPLPLRTALDQPPALSAWFPTVVLVGLIEAAYDVHFEHLGGVEAIRSYLRTTNRAVLGGPLYRILFAAISPSRLVAGAAMRWSAFHRGATIEVAARSTHRAELDLTHPASLYSDNALLAHGTGFSLAVELSGGVEPRVTFERTTPTTTHYLIVWR